jgi:hypothetical protein
MTAAQARHAPISIPDLRDVLNGQVIAPDDTEYDRARTIFYGGFDQRPAVSVEDRFGHSCWDALIVAAARIAGCERLLTEDLQHGAAFEGLQVVDPFGAVAGSLR